MESCRESFDRQRIEEDAYIKIYNEHYKSDNGLRPMFQLPSRYFSDILSFTLSKSFELGGAVATIYGIIQKPEYIPMGISFLISGLLIDIISLPFYKISRGKRLSERQSSKR